MKEMLLKEMFGARGLQGNVFRFSGRILLNTLK